MAGLDHRTLLELELFEIEQSLDILTRRRDAHKKEVRNLAKQLKAMRMRRARMVSAISQQENGSHDTAR